MAYGLKASSCDSLTANYELFFETLHLFNVQILLWLQWILSTLCGVLNSIYKYCSTIWSWINKVAFLGPIISKSKRFTGLSMPYLDSTAKTEPEKQWFEPCWGFITKFLPLSKSSSVLQSIFGADPVPP